MINLNTMKYSLIIMLLFVVAIFGCQSNEADDDPEEASCSVQAEILGQDMSRHMCGGGYIIRTADEQFAVLDILDEDILEDAFQLTIYDDPIKVYVNYSDLTDNGCDFYRKQLNCISRRN